MRAPHRPADRPVSRRTALLLSLLAWPLAACSSAPKGPVVARVTLYDHSGSNRSEQEDTGLRSLSLASNSHTDRLTYYSTPRDDANLKIVDDALMADLLGALNSRGFKKRARSSQPNELDTKAIVLEQNGSVQSFGVRAGSSAADWKAMQAMANEVMEVYNSTFGGQAIRSGRLNGVEADQQPLVVPLREVRAAGK